MRLTFYNDLELATRSSLTDRALGRIDAAGFSPEVGDFFKGLLAVARQEWSDDAWELFDECKDMKILRVDKWIFHFTFKVRHIEAFVKLLVGPRPYIPSGGR